MKKVLLLAGLLFSIQASAAIISVTGQGKIVTRNNIHEDKPTTNNKQKGFNEAQGVLLTRDITVDNHKSPASSSIISKGTYVDSHLIFFNSDGDTRKESTATWAFSGAVLGVMANTSGSNLLDTNDLFANGNYFSNPSKGLIAPFPNLGLEGGDSYSFIGDTVLDLKLVVTEPGDWIRVITAANVSAVPVPASAFLFGPALLGFIARRRMSK